MKKPDSNSLIDRFLQLFYDDAGDVFISSSHGDIVKAAMYVTAGKLKSLKKLKKWIENNVGQKLPVTKKGAEIFSNREGKLPTKDSNGNPITYKEYNINPISNRKVLIVRAL